MTKTSRHVSTPVQRPLPTLSAVQPRREGFPQGYDACPCCYGEGKLLAYDSPQHLIPLVEPCCHCQGTGQVKVAVAPPAKTAKSSKTAKRKGHKR